MRVLFIGNSFTQRNNVPGLIAQMARARGQELEHKLISQGGASLKMHWNKGAAQKAMSESRWDYVVLQEQSTLPVKNAERFKENVRLFDPAIRATGAKTALYLTWARAHAPESQRLLTDAYMSIGSEIGATVIPAGIAWERVLAEPTHPVLHDADGSHPTLAGSYLAACTFLATLFDENPVGIDMELKGLSTAEITQLQRAAWQSRGQSR